MDLSRLQNGSDVRGVALAGVENEPVTLDDAAVRAIAGGFVRFLRARLGKESCRVSVGRDSRLSGGAIAETLCETLAACGAEVTDLGLCTTPAMFMTTVTGERPFDAAVMITASHLPWNRNGLKFFTAAGGAESADVREILRLAAEETPLAPGGSVAQGEFMETYAAILREKIIAAANGNEKPLAGKHIVVDAGNGAGGVYEFAVQFLGLELDLCLCLGFLGSFVFCLPCCGLYAVYLGLVGLYLCICRLDLFTYFRSVAVQYYPSGVFAVKVFAKLLLQLFNVVLAAAYQSVEFAHLQHVSGPAGYVAGDAA